VGHSANTAVFLNGKIYIGGGERRLQHPLYQINIYDADNDSWSSPVTTQHCYFAMTSLNNCLIIAGGVNQRGVPTDQIFMLNNDLLNEYTKMKRPRGWATAVGYQKMLLIIGGKVGLKVFGSTELFNSETGQWYDCEDLPQPHYWIQSVVVDNTVYLLGGFDEDCSCSQSVFSSRLDSLLNQKLKWNTEKPTPWNRSAPAAIFGKHILTFGGVKVSILRGYLCTTDVYMLNMASHNWEVVGHVPSTRDGPSAVSIADDKIIVLGGVDHNSDKSKYTNTVWIGLCT